MKLVLVALGATALSAFVLTGCGKQEESVPQASSASPEVYMKDKAFRKELKDLRVQRGDFAEAHAGVVKKMEALVDAKASALKGVSRDKAREALKGDPEWQSLEQRRRDLEQALKENQAKALAKVRARLTPKEKPISK